MSFLASAQGLQLKSAGGMAGFNFYDQGEWALVRSELANEADHPVDAVLLVAFKDAPGLQYGNRLTLPPRSRREVLTMVSPHGLPSQTDTRGAELQVTLIQEQDGTQRVVDSAIGAVAVREPALRSADAKPQNDDGPGNTHRALRLHAGQGRTTFSASPRMAPDIAAVWGGLDTFMLARDDGWSPAQIRAIRQWLFDGGRLWIMLDQTGPELPRAILGQHWPLAWIDRAAYTTLTLRGDGVEHTVALDYPVEMARVVAEEPAQVRLEAQGYPAAATWRVGQGRVLVTTLASGAWLEGEKANPALAALEDFFDVDRRPTDATMTRATSALDATAPRVQGLIGHRVLGRGTVVLVLAVFLGAMLAAGLWLLRRGRLEWAAPAGVGLGLVTAAVLVGVGWVTLARTPGVTVIAEQRRTEAGSPTASIRAMVAVYRQPGAAQLSRLTYDGPPPVLTDQLAAIGPRLLRTDAESWSIENVNLAPGEVHSIGLNGSVAAPSTAALVEGRLGESGLELRFLGEARPALDDALLVTARGRVAVEPGDHGWRADLSRPLTGNQYTAATVLSQRQMQRSEAYAALLGDASRFDRPMLLGWAGGTTVSVGAIDGTELRRDALIAYPVTFTPPKPGQTVRIPPMLMAMSAYHDRQVGVAGTIYDPKSGQWVENVSNAQTVAMSYQPPEAFAGLELTEAELTLNLRIPGREYQVITVRDGKLVTLARGENPGGMTTHLLTGDDLPAQRADGSVLVGLRVGEGPRTQIPKPWTLSRMELAVTGRAPAP